MESSESTRPIQIIYRCPACQEQDAATLSPSDAQLACRHCDWKRDEGKDDFSDDRMLKRCRICGCTDLWRQKDFPPGLGLIIIATEMILSTIAWAMYEPTLTYGILLAFAFVDMLLYAFMGDMLVCYRCRARHRRTAMHDEHPRFELEIAERYRQQEKRLRGEI